MRAALVALVVAAGVAASAIVDAQGRGGRGAAAGTVVGPGSVEHITVHGKALEGNLEGDSPDRDVTVYLPPGYSSDQMRRYPVVYLLHGYGLTGERWVPFINLPDAADKDAAEGMAKEMILVSPDAFTKYSGSMYSSSPVTGDWEAFILAIYKSSLAKGA